MNRFIIVEMDFDEGPYGVCCDSKKVSERVDMADCYNSPYKIYYIGNGGFITEVRVGPTWKESIEDNNSIVCGHANLLIHNQYSVGQVHYTDH